MSYERVSVINEDTGEVLARHIIKSDSTYTSKLINEKQKEAYKNKLEKDTNLIELTGHIKEYGFYFHSFIQYLNPYFIEMQQFCSGNKSNIHIIRFLLLSTYISNSGNLYDKNNNAIKKSSLSKIWDVKNNRKSINETYNILKEIGYIHEDERGNLMVNEKIVSKGKVDKNSGEYTRVFIDTLQDLYYNCVPKKRGQLANFYKAIPFINRKHNVFCSNPMETDIDKVIPLKWTELARLCGYEDNKNIAKFKKDLRFFTTKDEDYLIGQFEIGNHKAIVVNPRLYYGGSNAEELKGVENLFRIRSSR